MTTVVRDITFCFCDEPIQAVAKLGKYELSFIHACSTLFATTM